MQSLRLIASVVSIFADLDKDQPDFWEGILIAREGNYDGYCFQVDLKHMSFYLAITEERSEWGESWSCPGEGDMYYWTETIYQVEIHGLDEMHLARLLYVYLSKYVDTKALPQGAFLQLRQIALGK